MGGQSEFFGEFGGADGALDHRVDENFGSGFWFFDGGIFVHQVSEEVLVERSPIDADANGFLIFDGDFDDLGKVVIVFIAEADIAGVDAIFVEGLRHCGIFAEESVAVVVKIADEWDVREAFFVESGANFGDGFSGGIGVDGDADEFGAGFD